MRRASLVFLLSGVLAAQTGSAPSKAPDICIDSATGRIMPCPAPVKPKPRPHLDPKKAPVLRMTSVLDDGSTTFATTDDPTIPITRVEPVTQPVLHCLSGWHVEVWHSGLKQNSWSIMPAIPDEPDSYRPYVRPQMLTLGDDSDSGHPPKCVLDPKKASDAPDWPKKEGARPLRQNEPQKSRSAN